MTRLSIAACLSAAALTVSFGCSPKEFGSVCDEVSAPAGCKMACDPAPGAPNVCASGLHCSPDGLCDAQCTQGGNQCGDGYSCTLDGRCVDDGTGTGVNGPDASCPAINFTPMPTTPSIGLVLDQSGSMYDFTVPGGSTGSNKCNDPACRFRVMREALVGTSGVVSQLQSKAYFGANLYTCANNANAIQNIPRSMNNAAGIRAAIDAKIGSPGLNTPTDAAIRDMVAQFAANPPPAGSPPAIVLATDGVPNSCGGNSGGEGPTEQAAAAAFAAGIPVYVLAIGIDSQHFQRVANLGQGWQQGQPNIPYFPVTNAAQLASAFQTVINGVISCDLSLTSPIDPTQAMNGTVTVNNTQLTYGSDWTLVAPGNNIIRLQGAACTMLKTTTSPVVSAQFPCGSVIL